MTKPRAAAAGISKQPSSTATPRPIPATAPITTTRDTEQNTYTSERSEQLREGNTTTR